MSGGSLASHRAREFRPPSPRARRKKEKPRSKVQGRTSEAQSARGLGAEMRASGPTPVAGVRSRRNAMAGHGFAREAGPDGAFTDGNPEVGPGMTDNHN